jgi:hypothetical protein
MHADVERFSFDPHKHFVRVLEQQGRVTLAAESNEQTAIVLHFLQSLAADTIGPAGTPSDPDDNGKAGPGFAITLVDESVVIGKGHYWVDGILCENETADLSVSRQPDYPLRSKRGAGVWLYYLDTWERHISVAEDDTIREVALGGPDSCSRTRQVWQVKARQVELGPEPARADAEKYWTGSHKDWAPGLRARPRLVVEVQARAGVNDPCQTPASFGYYGNENQLYRVEIRDGGGLGDPQVAETSPPSFVWSRDNGSVIYPLAEIKGAEAVLRDPPLDCRKQLEEGTVVEIVDDQTSLLGRPGPLVKVVAVDDDGDDVVVTLSAGVANHIPSDRHPYLRRWDGAGDADATGQVTGIPIVESTSGSATWFELEDGIRVRFEAAPEPEPSVYWTADYWTFAARAATGTVAWPADVNGPQPQEPHGVQHHVALLAAVTITANGAAPAGNAVQDCRYFIPRMAVPTP